MLVCKASQVQVQTSLWASGGLRLLEASEADRLLRGSRSDRAPQSVAKAQRASVPSLRVMLAADSRDPPFENIDSTGLNSPENSESTAPNAQR